MIFACSFDCLPLQDLRSWVKPTTALAEGLMNKIAVGTGGIDFDYIGKDSFVYAGFICGECHLYVCPGLISHDRHHAEDLLQDA